LQDSTPDTAADATPPETPPGESDASTSTARRVRPRRRRRRWRFWLFVLALLVAGRIALPILLGPFLEERLSRVLGTTVDVGDVSFAPIDAIVTLRNVTVQAPGALSDSEPPALEAARVRLDLQWLPLIHRSLLVREVTIESGRVDLARLAAARETAPDDGSPSGIDALLRIDPSTELPAGWSFALDRIALRDSQVKVGSVGEGDPAPLELGVRDAQVSLQRRRASAFGRAPNLRIDAMVEGGRIRIDGTSDVRDDGVLIDTLVRIKDVPLTRLQPYVANLGWTTFAGRLSGQLRYQRDPGRRDLLSGHLQARRVLIEVPSHEGAALAVRRIEADVDAIDLAQRRVAVETVSLHGARLAIRPDLAAPLPLLDGIPFAPPPPVKQRRPQVAAARVAPWTWTIGNLATPFARLHVAGAAGEVVLAASMSGESLGPGAYWSPVRAWIGRGGGVAIFDGTARMTRGLLLDGRLTATDLDVPAVARTLGLPYADLAQSGRGAAELAIEIEPASAKEPPLDVRGQITLSGVALSGPLGDELALGADAVDLKLAGVDLVRGEDGAVVTTSVRFSDALLRSPYALFTRTPEGWVVPPFTPEATDPGAVDATALDEDADRLPAAPVAAPAPAAVRAIAAAPNADVAVPEPTPEPTPPPRAEAVINSLRSTRGRLLLVDTTLEPARTFDVAVTEGWAQGLRLPQATLGSFVAQGSDPRFGTVQLGGSRSADVREIDLFAQSIPLAATAPYLEQAGLPYVFTSGTGSLLSRVVVAGDRWSADTTLTLHEPRIAGDEAALRQSLGMSSDAAFAALRDRDGDVTLRLPLASSTADPRPMPDVIAAAVRDAVTRARQAPLPEAPLQIVFAPGRAELSVQGVRQLGSITELLAARRDAVVELTGGWSSADRRWLAEQELIDDLEEPGGFMGVLRALGVRGQTERIREALEERGAGRPGRLDQDDEETVDRLIAEGPPIADDRLVALAEARLARVQTVLADQGVTRARVLTATTLAREGAAPPVVRARIAVDPRLPGLAGIGDVRR